MYFVDTLDFIYIDRQRHVFINLSFFTKTSGFAPVVVKSV